MVDFTCPLPPILIDLIGRFDRGGPDMTSMMSLAYVDMIFEFDGIA